MKLKDKVALVTGGARGIGKAVALAYAREGARLAICARTTSEIDETVQDIQKLKAEAKGWFCDVSVEDSVKDFVGDVIKDFGRIDVLVNNAGVMDPAGSDHSARSEEVGLYDCGKFARSVSHNSVGVARHDQAKKRLDHQRFVDGGTRRLRQLYRLCHFKMGTGRIHSDPGRGSPHFKHPRQFRRTRLRGNQIDGV